MSHPTQYANTYPHGKKRKIGSLPRREESWLYKHMTWRYSGEKEFSDKKRTKTSRSYIVLAKKFKYNDKETVDVYRHDYHGSTLTGTIAPLSCGDHSF
jgi:hypothetical protein